MAEFDWLTGPHFEAAAEIISGTVLEKITYPFSSETMDASFAFSTTTVEAVKTFARERGYELSHVVILTAFRTKLKRTSTQFKSESILYLVQNEEQTNALLFLGCSLEG